MLFYQSFTNPANVWVKFKIFNWISRENGKRTSSQGKILVLQIIWPFTQWNRFIFLDFPLFEEKMFVHRHKAMWELKALPIRLYQEMQRVMCTEKSIFILNQ